MTTVENTREAARQGVEAAGSNGHSTVAPTSESAALLKQLGLDTVTDPAQRSVVEALVAAELRAKQAEVESREFAGMVDTAEAQARNHATVSGTAVDIAKELATRLGAQNTADATATRLQQAAATTQGFISAVVPHLPSILSALTHVANGGDPMQAAAVAKEAATRQAVDSAIATQRKAANEALKPDFQAAIKEFGPVVGTIATLLAGKLNTAAQPVLDRVEAGVRTKAGATPFEQARALEEAAKLRAQAPRPLGPTPAVRQAAPTETPDQMLARMFLERMQAPAAQPAPVAAEAPAAPAPRRGFLGIGKRG